MKTLFHNFFIILTILTITFSCASTSKLYRMDDKEKISTGKLSDLEFRNLSQILETATSSKVKDTLIIKYDYNNEGCWNRLDQKKDEYIKSIITERQQRMQNVLDVRPDVSVFNFREPGNNLNKIKKWDDFILIDKDKKLFNLLFSQRSTCGNSMLIMPDKQFIFIRSDPHSEVIDLTQNKIEEILNNKEKIKSH